MCVVSMVMDHYSDEWSRRFGTGGTGPVWPFVVTTPPTITPQELEEFRRLLDRAREYDKKHNEPDCELASKRERIRKLAAELGVEVDFV
jgi:hypothetical protein